MPAYCLEVASDTDAIIHLATCGEYDHASLLGQGKLYALGDFDNSRDALAAVRPYVPVATRCLDCCKADLLRTPSPSMLANDLNPIAKLPARRLTDVTSHFAAVV